MRVDLANSADIAAIAPDLAELPLCRTYGMSEAALTRRLQRALAEGAGIVVAREAETAQPLGLAWYDARGAFATGAYLRLLLVAPQALGRGCGAALLQAFESRAGEPPGGYFALTNAAAGTAVGFYARYGYRQVGVLPDFVRPGQTETLLWRPYAVVGA